VSKVFLAILCGLNVYMKNYGMAAFMALIFFWDEK
jgi:hypothetical protein